MAFVTLLSSGLLTGTASAFSADANYPASNATDYLHPYRPYKATGASTSEYVQYDLGSAQTIYGFFVDTHNVAAPVVEASNASNMSSIEFTSVVGGHTATLDSSSNRYKWFYWNSGSALCVPCRYWRLSMGTASLTSGSVMQIGSWSLFSSAPTQWTQSAEFPYTRTALVATTATEEFQAGGREPLEIGNSYSRISLPASNMVPEMETTLWTLAGVGQAGTFLFYRNYNSDLSQAYIVHRVGDISISMGSPNMVSVSQIVLDEVC